MNFINNFKVLNPITCTDQLQYVMGNINTQDECKTRIQLELITTLALKIIGLLGILSGLNGVRKSILNPFSYIVLALAHDLLAVAKKVEDINLSFLNVEKNVKERPVAGGLSAAAGFVATAVGATKKPDPITQFANWRQEPQKMLPQILKDTIILKLIPWPKVIKSIQDLVIRVMPEQPQ